MSTTETRFIEKATHYELGSGNKLSIYETNTPCKNIEFYFNKYVVTMMLTGHKVITTENNHIDFYPHTIFIPEKNTVQKVSISDANLSNPTQCLVLDVSAEFLEDFYEELLNYPNNFLQKQQAVLETNTQHFFYDEDIAVESFLRLYHAVKGNNCNDCEITYSLMLKEFLIRLFKTEAFYLLKDNFENAIKDKKVAKTIHYIKANLTKKITINELATVAGLGKTNLFSRFKKNTGVTPVGYIMNERILFSKKLMQKSDNLQNIAFQSGFNTYEHYCNSFKKITGLAPSKYIKEQFLNAEVGLQNTAF